MILTYNLDTVLGNRQEEKCYKVLHAFNTSLGQLNLVMNVNRSDFKNSKQISPVMVLVFL